MTTKTNCTKKIGDELLHQGGSVFLICRSYRNTLCYSLVRGCGMFLAKYNRPGDKNRGDRDGIFHKKGAIGVA